MNLRKLAQRKCEKGNFFQSASLVVYEENRNIPFAFCTAKSDWVQLLTWCVSGLDEIDILGDIGLDFALQDFVP